MYNKFIQTKDANGYTAYLHAATIGDNKYLKDLSSRNCDITVKSNEGRCVLHLICNQMYNNNINLELENQ